MFFTAAILLAQTATLPTDTFDAAKICARATVIANTGQKSPLHLTSQYVFYMTHAARANSGGQALMDRLKELSSATPAGEMSEAESRTLTAACEKRFARPQTVTAAQLPKDGFQRDVMCFSMLSLLQGAAQEVKTSSGDDASLARIEAALNPLLVRLTDEELTKRGLDGDDKFLKLLGDQLAASLALGEPIAVAAACGAPGL